MHIPRGETFLSPRVLKRPATQDHINSIDQKAYNYLPSYAPNPPQPPSTLTPHLSSYPPLPSTHDPGPGRITYMTTLVSPSPLKKKEQQDAATKDLAAGNQSRRLKYTYSRKRKKRSRDNVVKESSERWEKGRETRPDACVKMTTICRQITRLFAAGLCAGWLEPCK